MTPERTRQLNQRIKERPALRKAVSLADSCPVWAVMILYAVALIREAVGGSARHFFLLVLLPAAAFLLTTALRRIIHKPRPYQAAGTELLVDQRSESYAMPSRHTTSAFAIGSSLLALGYPVFGAAALILGVIIGAARVLGGAHDLSDVTVGALIGAFSGIIVYWMR